MTPSLPIQIRTNLQLLIAITFIAAFVSGCTTRKSAADVRPSDPAPPPVRKFSDQQYAIQNTILESPASAAAWPGVKAAVMCEVARVEGRNSAFASAYYSPCVHTNGYWAVIVHLASPDWRTADHLFVFVWDSGQIASYTKAGRSQAKPK